MASAEPLFPHFSNSVHGLDLLQFLFGRLEVVHTERLPLARRSGRRAW